MSEYVEVEQPLAQLAAQGWEVIDQGPEIPSAPATMMRDNSRQWVLPEVFRQSVAAVNPGPGDGTKEAAYAKARTAERWVRAVNTSGEHGHWDYAVVEDPQKLGEVVDALSSPEVPG